MYDDRTVKSHLRKLDPEEVVQLAANLQIEMESHNVRNEEDNKLIEALRVFRDRLISEVCNYCKRGVDVIQADGIEDEGCEYWHKTGSGRLTKCDASGFHKLKKEIDEDGND